MKLKTGLEILSVEHEGVVVNIEIDYISMTATLVEYFNKEWRPKKWLFAGRTIEYLGPWKLIFEAMDNAVEVAKGRLEERKEENEAVKIQNMIKVQKALESKDL